MAKHGQTKAKRAKHGQTEPNIAEQRSHSTHLSRWHHTASHSDKYGKYDKYGITPHHTVLMISPRCILPKVSNWGLCACPPSVTTIEVRWSGHALNLKQIQASVLHSRSPPSPTTPPTHLSRSPPDPTNIMPTVGGLPRD